jgi:hypothetical protein
MEIGFTTDFAYGSILQASWSPGEPVMRRFVGGVKFQKRDARPIVTYRCTGCGYLESYAGV